MFSTGTLWGLVPIGAAFGLFLFMRTLLQRTPAGARRAAEWDGLRSFLKDFSRLDEAVSGDLIIYERYLVAAVALGVADELVRGLSLKVPEVVANPGFATWYVASSLDHGHRRRRTGRVRLVRLHLRLDHRRVHAAVQRHRWRRRVLRRRGRRRRRWRLRCQLTTIDAG